MNKMLFFRDQADEANVNGIDDQLCIPASRLISMAPGSDTTIEMDFLSVKNNELAHNEQLSYDKVTLTVKEGDIQEALDGLAQAITGNGNGNGFIVIADDCAKTDSDTTALDDVAIPTKYVHPSITGVASITVSDELYRTQLPSLSMGNAAPTATAAGALAVNTAYTNAETAARAYTIPSASGGKAGDWITVVYTAAIGNGNAHTYSGTTDVNYAPGSIIMRSGGSAAGKVDVSTTNDDVITITGATNGDGGIGTTLKFVNMTGTTNGWAVEAITRSQGDGTTAGALAFSAA